jgi:predicted dehydrogenase
MLRLAIVGVGWAGSHHVEGARELGGKVVVDCLVDTDAEFLAGQARELDVEKTYADYDAALRDDHIDAVSICSPHPCHCAQAVAAAEAGKHVLVEKPMAMDVEEATRMIAAAEQNGVRLYVAESATYEPVAKFLRGVIQSGEYIGELTAASLTRGFRARLYGYPGRRAWLAEPKKGGRGTWTLHGIHTVGQLRYVLGEVRTVYVQEHKASSYGRDDVEGTMSGLLTLASGVRVALLQTSETKFYADLGGYVLHGDRGSIRAGDESCRVFNDECDGEEIRYSDDALSVFAQEIEAFANYALEGVEGPTTGAMERRSLAIVQAGYESAESGLPVDLETRFGAL